MALKVYQRAGSIDTLGRVIEETRKRLYRYRKSRNPSVEKHLDNIRLLGGGYMTSNSASSFIDAYKALWPDAVTSSTASIVTPKAIMKLDAAIHQGVLTDHMFDTFCIPDAFYRTFVMIFCDKAFDAGFIDEGEDEDDDDADDDPNLREIVARAYELTKGCVGASLPTDHTVQPIWEDVGIEFISKRITTDEQWIRFLDGHINKILGHFQIEANLELVDTPNIKPLFRKLSTSLDSQFTHTGLSRLWHTVVTLLIDPLRRMRNELGGEVEITKAMLKALTVDEEIDPLNDDEIPGHKSGALRPSQEFDYFASPGHGSDALDQGQDMDDYFADDEIPARRSDDSGSQHEFEDRESLLKQVFKKHRSARRPLISSDQEDGSDEEKGPDTRMGDDPKSIHDSDMESSGEDEGKDEGEDEADSDATMGDAPESIDISDSEIGSSDKDERNTIDDQNVQADIESSGATTQNERDGHSSDDSDVMKDIPMEEEKFIDWDLEDI
ncbi:hypothetical protein FVEN_g3341 [Fusarium venenatum]|nr:hypothetical protein FVEN_g3341 [Fusarium venenatum]